MSEALPASTDQPTDMHVQIAELRSQLDELRSQLVTSQTATGDAAAVIETESTSTRRGWMKAAAAAAVGGTAVALSGGERIAARDTDPIRIGQTNNVGASRTLATHEPNDRSEMSFLFRTETGFNGSGALFPAALGGWTGASARPNGIYGFTEVDDDADANGVVGVAVGAGAGVRGENNSIGGRGLVGDARGNGGTGAHVRGGFVGVDAEGAQFGVVATGDIAALLLSPANTVAPPDRADGQTGGSLDVQRLSDSGAASLWFCSAPGSPGVWQKLAGPATAGAFHAIEPGRGYDSRTPAPSPGRLSAGADRVVSVAAGRDLDTGAINRAGMVPDGATAITYNLTIIDTVGGGFLSVTPGSASDFGAASINWASSGTTVANAGVIKLDLDRQIKVFCGGAGSTDFVIDVTGYYR